MIEWYDKPWTEVVKTLESNMYSGLDEEQIKPHRDKYGSNKIAVPKPPTLGKLIKNQIKNFWMIILIIVSAAFIYLGQYVPAGVGFFIIIVNFLFVVLSEYNEGKKLKTLQKLNMGLARVVREGRTLKIPAEQLVVGDILIVGKGDSIKADLRVIESDDLKVNESSVTGKNFISEKYETKIIDKELKLSDMKNILFKSSYVTDGSGTGIVIATGMNTQISNIIKLFLGEKENGKSFNERVNGILNLFTLYMLIPLIMILGIDFFQKQNVKYLIKFFSTMLLNSIPQTMIVIMSIVSIILLGIAKKQSIEFKNLSVMEKLSQVSVICTDKIGAFSSNKMKVAKIYSDEVLIDAIGEELKQGISEDKDVNMYRMTNIGLLCNDTKSSGGKLVNSKDDLMEIALVKFARENGIDKRDLERKHERVKQISFDTERRMMTTINVVDENYRANIKGAVDSILSRCTYIMKDGLEAEITEEDIEKIKQADINMSNECLSVIAVAYRNFIYEPSLNENIESHLVFAGLFGFENIIREDALEAIEKSSFLNIKPIIITDDNKLTAFALGKKLETISNLQQILSGVEIDNMPDEEFKRVGDKINIFSRIDSRHKVKIIRNLKEYGYTTAITGAKLTDLPALRVSDVGITTSSSNIVKKLSDIVVKDINFLQILNSIEDSRKIISVIKKVILYIITNSAAMFIFVCMMHLYKKELPFMMQEGLIFSCLVMVLSCIAITYQYKNEKRECDSYIIDKDIVKDNKFFIISNAALMGIAAFIAFQLGYSKGIIFAQALSIGVLNLNSIIFTYSFSNKLFFKNAFSNFVIFISFIIQWIILYFISGFNVIFNLNYLRTIGIFIGICFIICLFKKFDKEEIYD
ncbi:cation-transporting P-type ATPase [Clostridium sp. P21]|uniref:Cation-transporting P-type ATPase n=1 Tax=Clostridium muellerianum TaxID=2716538 RepID=A0A7Y0HLJ1_9CLOT|nr:HAD-IC family P-type ATPase [Clostridium muellerianum]NMM61964.1 cation-transporting P-type ATPase [Clostridium muellerianum]